jgi:coproporphyrinogen III oxidase-like Fe-S oxidoreductase
MSDTKRNSLTGLERFELGLHMREMVKNGTLIVYEADSSVPDEPKAKHCRYASGYTDARVALEYKGGGVVSTGNVKGVRTSHYGTLKSYSAASAKKNATRNRLTALEKQVEWLLKTVVALVEQADKSGKEPEQRVFRSFDELPPFEED